MWMQLRWNMTETDPLKEFHEWGMGVEGGGDEQCDWCNRSSWNYYQVAQDRVVIRLINLPYCPMGLLLASGMQLRRVPLYSQALVFSLLPFIQTLQEVARHVNVMAPTRVLSYFLERCAFWYCYHSGLYALLIWVLAPAMSATARQHGRAREVSRVWIVLMLSGLAYWTVAFLRVFNGWRMLYVVLETDHGLEGVAAAVTYLTSSILDLDVYLPTTMPMAVGIIYSTLSRSGGNPHPHPRNNLHTHLHFHPHGCSPRTYSRWGCSNERRVRSLGRRVDSAPVGVGLLRLGTTVHGRPTQLALPLFGDPARLLP